MKIFFQDVEVFTKGRTEVVDITNFVEEAVSKSEVKNGLCIIHSVHSTTAIIVNENEAGLREDIRKKIASDYPKGAGWRHDRIDDNADAHLASAFIGASRILPVKDGRLARGVWQNIFLLELDGPRSRRIIVEVIGE